jgi:hypothetical protein
MAIAPIPEFERFLSSISFDTHAAQEGRQFFDVICSKNHFDGKRYLRTPAISASYFLGEMTFDAALKRLGEEVRKSKHLAGDSMLRLLLGMSAASRPLETSAVAHFNNMLDKICECDCSSFLIGRIEERSAARKKIGNFYVGQVDVEKIRYRCKKVRCDFFSRYPDAFQDSYGVEKEPSKIRVIDFGAVPSPRVQRSKVSAMEDEYFDLISLHLFKEFVQEFGEETLLANALGAPFLDLQGLLAMNGSFVSIFQKIGSREVGHFRPIGSGGSIVFRRPEGEISNVQTALREQFSFSRFDDIEVHHSLRSFSKLVVRARRLREDGAALEAFLACVIALESIFVDDRVAIARSLSNRLAVVAAGPLAQRVAEVEKLITKIYDSRSKYVHKGIEVSKDYLEAVWRIVEAAIEAMLRLQANSPDRGLISMESWLKKLDHLYTSLAADETPPASKFIENGLVPPPMD